MSIGKIIFIQSLIVIASMILSTNALTCYWGYFANYTVVCQNYTSPVCTQYTQYEYKVYQCIENQLCTDLKAASNQITSNVRCCNTDLCNFSSRFAPSVSLIILVIGRIVEIGIWARAKIPGNRNFRSNAVMKLEHD